MDQQYLFSLLDHRYYERVEEADILYFEKKIGFDMPAWLQQLQLSKGGGSVKGTNLIIALRDGSRMDGPVYFNGLNPRTVEVEDMFEKLAGNPRVMRKISGTGLLEMWNLRADFSIKENELPFADDLYGGKFVVSLGRSGGEILHYCELGCKLVSQDFPSFLKALSEE